MVARPISERCLCNGRGENQQFADDERLWLRVRAAEIDQVTTPGHVYLHELRTPNTSVNRQHPDGQKDDVLHPNYHAEYGVIELRAKDVRMVYAEHGTSIEFDARHVPLCDEEPQNYYHSEVQAFAGSDRSAKKASISKAQKRWYKEELQWRLTPASIVIQPPVIPSTPGTL